MELDRERDHLANIQLKLEGRYPKCEDSREAFIIILNPNFCASSLPISGEQRLNASLQAELKSLKTEKDKVSFKFGIQFVIDLLYYGTKSDKFAHMKNKNKSIVFREYCMLKFSPNFFYVYMFLILVLEP